MYNHTPISVTLHQYDYSMLAAKEQRHSTVRVNVTTHDSLLSLGSYMAKLSFYFCTSFYTLLSNYLILHA